MSEPSPAAPPVPQSWPVLNLTERRVLGVMAEKAKTTPDAYPMSLNALVTGCNQKSNRDPVLNLSDEEAEEALRSSQQKGLAIRVTSSGRVERWKHNLYDALQVNKVELAVLAELLLRGPQTEGELRGRAARMEPIDDLEALREVLKPLADRRLVVYLSPENRRGTVLTHGFHAAQELEKLRSLHGAGGAVTDEGPPPAPAPRSASGPATAPAPRVASAAVPMADERAKALEVRLEAAQVEVKALRGSVSELQSVVTELKAQVASLGEQLRALKEALGA
jgi:uncharacterized protein YceH (UPF0502 family)